MSFWVDVLRRRWPLIPVMAAAGAASACLPTWATVVVVVMVSFLVVSALTDRRGA